MGTPVLSFTVLGEAAPAGSKRAFRNPHSGRIMVTDASKGSKPWKAEVKAAAAGAFNGGGLLTGPLRLDLVFYKPRPAAHFGTGRNAGTLKASAPPFPATRPDVLKLARGVEDALTGIVWRDDAQIVVEHLEKRYGSPARCEVRVWTEDA
jgi:Holliday junction resolvase RusA-like endonuclease